MLISHGNRSPFQFQAAAKAAFFVSFRNIKRFKPFQPENIPRRPYCRAGQQGNTCCKADFCIPAGNIIYISHAYNRDQAEKNSRYAHHELPHAFIYSVHIKVVSAEDTERAGKFSGSFDILFLLRFRKGKPDKKK